MEKILITGASGFVGSFLVEEALNRGLEVYAGIRKSSSKRYLQDDRIHFTYLNFEDSDELNSILIDHAFTRVIHNAGITKASSASEYDRVNSKYTGHLAKICNNLDSIKKFVFISSLAAYGPADHLKKGMLDEDAPPNPITAYGRSKLSAEKQIKALTALPWNIVRPTAVFGPRDQDLYAIFKIVKYGFAPLIGFKKQKLSFIYVKDLARLVLNMAMMEPDHREVFATDGKAYSTRVFNQKIESALDKNALSIRIPVFLLKGLAYSNEFVGKILNKYPAFNLEKVNELTSLNWTCNTSTMQKDFNFAPAYRLEEAIAETVEWYKANNWL